MKRRILSLLLVVCVALSLSGCDVLLSAAQQALSATAVPQTTMALPVLEDTDASEGDATPAQEEPSGLETAQAGESEDTQQPQSSAQPEQTPAPIDPAGSYTEKDDIALYLQVYGKLPDNFITKKQAQELGWPGGGLDDYAYGKCIGGDRFGNYEGLLPKQSGRTYYECDVGTLHKSKRGAKRIIFSNDGLIYYTDDHYESFELLYDGNA